MMQCKYCGSAALFLMDVKHREGCPCVELFPKGSVPAPEFYRELDTKPIICYNISNNNAEIL